MSEHGFLQNAAMQQPVCFGDRAYLTVDEITKLAAAGVKIDFNDVRDQVISNGPRDQQRPRTLMDAFWERWRRSNCPDPNSGNGEIPPFGAQAHEHGDKVSVFFCPHGEPPFIIEDERALFPSDALMSKLHLWVKTNGGNKSILNSIGAATQQGSPGAFGNSGNTRRIR